MNRDIVIGILGGMGPNAATYFVKRLLDLTPVKMDRDHFRTIIDNNVKIPSRTRAVKYGEESPVKDMIYCINNLADIGCEYVMLPCNSAHYFYNEVSPKIKIPWLNMIEIVSKKTSSQDLTKPLILGGFVTTKKRIYSQYIPGAVYLDEYDNNKIEEIIEEIKSYQNISKDSLEILKELIADVNQSIDSIILACTELPIVLSNIYLEGKQVISSVDEYIFSLLSN